MATETHKGNRRAPGTGPFPLCQNEGRLLLFRLLEALRPRA